LKTLSFDDVVKNTVVKILEQGGPPGAPPPPPADPSKITNLDKEQLDPIIFVQSRIKSLIELGPDDFIKKIKEMNLEARKPLQIKSDPIDQTKDIEDFIKSFKKTYTEDYLTLKRFIDVTSEGSDKFESLKKDIKKLINLSQEHLETAQETITPSNVEAAPM